MRSCSFCGRREDEVGTLVEGPRKTSICDSCVELAADLVKERLTPPGGDLLLDDIGTLATNDPRFAGVLGAITDAAVAVRKGRIAWAGPRERLPQGLESLPRLDCEGRAVLPGLIDAHTHLLFAGDRSREFELRMAGISEAEASMRSGGSEATARQTSDLDRDELTDLLEARLGRMLESGTTTAEAAAGYTTDHVAELRLLEAAGLVHRRQPVDLVRTFDVIDLPQLPSERPARLVELAEDVLPAALPHAEAIRVACGKESLSLYEAHDLLQAAEGLGARTRIHAGRGSATEISQLAVDARSAVIDHCGPVGPDRAAALGQAGVAVVATPTTVLAERLEAPDVQEMVRLGVPVALGTDAGPAPVMVESMPLVVSLAVLELGLTPDQAVWSATRGGAIALDLRDRGYVGHGALADLLVLDADRPTHLAYRPGTDVIWKVFKQGVPVVSR